MRAAIRERYGAPLDVVRVVDRPVPAVSEDGVLIRVAAGGLNSLDWRLTRASPGLVRLSLGLRAPRDPRLGEDVSGTVVETGSAVTRFKVGDTVFGQATGAFAEFVVAKERHLALAPQNLPLPEAAALAVAGKTALDAINMGDVGPGSRVLVIGAAGGVGNYCVQLAVARGASVTGVCSTASIEHVRALGVDRVIDYRVEELDGEYDLIVELAVAAPLRRIAGMLAPRGTLVLSSGDGSTFLGPLPRFIPAALDRRIRVLSSVTTTDGLLELARLAGEGALAPVVTARFPLEDAAAAIAHVDSGRTRGKALLEPAG